MSIEEVEADRRRRLERAYRQLHNTRRIELTCAALTGILSGRSSDRDIPFVVDRAVTYADEALRLLESSE